MQTMTRRIFRNKSNQFGAEFSINMTSLVKFASLFFMVGVLSSKITVSKENAINLQTRSAQYRYQPSDEDYDFYDTPQGSRGTNPWFRNQPRTNPEYNDRSFHGPKHHHYHHHNCHHSGFQPWEFYPDYENEEETTFRTTTVKKRPIVTTTTTTTIIPEIDIRIGRKRRSILQL